MAAEKSAPIPRMSADERREQVLGAAVRAFARAGYVGTSTDHVGRVAQPVDGYLLTVDLPADATGRTVTVRYSPPGWHLELASLGLAVLGGVAWCGVVAVSRRRRR